MEDFYFNQYNIKNEDLFIRKVNEPEVVEEKYAAGVKIDLKADRPKYFYKNKDVQKLDLLPGVQLPPIISTRLKDFYQSKKMQHLEFYPVDVICEEDGSIDSSYFLLNILNNIECLDKKKSDYSLFHPDYEIIVSVNKLVLDTAKISRRDIFRIAEYPALIIYSNDLRIKIENDGFTGFNFLKTNLYKPI